MTDTRRDDGPGKDPEEGSSGPTTEPAAGIPADLVTSKGEEAGSSSDLSDDDLGDAEGGLGGLAYAD